MLAAVLLAGVVVGATGAADNWPTYLHGPGHTAASTETAISPENAARLRKLWAFQTHGGVAASPTVSGGVVYVGSWDGYEYALNAATGRLKWKTYLGVTNGGPTCEPRSLGVTSSATVQNGVVYVGGGDAYWYALSASTGAVLWRVATGDNSASGGHYNWASPLIYAGFAYIGIASLGDCPIVQGQLLRVDLRTRKVVATFDVVPAGHVGGGIWTSPTIDPATNTVYVTTGSQGRASQPYSQAFVALNAKTLAVEGSWHVPRDQRVRDGDWGTTPTLISGGLVVAANKNGVFYAFRGANVSAGPVWERRVSNGGSCPECGAGAVVSSAAFGGGRLYLAGEKTNIAGLAYDGSVSAVNPANGRFLWRTGTQWPVIPALAYVNGLVLAGAGSNLDVLAAATGKLLFGYATAGSIYSPPSVAGGRIYVGSQDGRVYALAVGTAPPPPNTVRVNAGGESYTDSRGDSWSADCCYTGGRTFSTTTPIAGTKDAALYQSQHWGSAPFSYTFSGLAKGAYRVTLGFAEIAGLGPGAREFNVAINGVRVLANFDVAAEVGEDVALNKSFVVRISGGRITVSFSLGAANNPIISAIQIVPVRR